MLFRSTPGVRPCTTLSPSLALRDGQPYMAFGTPGGDQQDQWSLAFFLRHAVHGLNLQEAIDAPAFRSSHWPDSFWPRQAHPGRLIAESRFGTAVLDDLAGAPVWGEAPDGTWATTRAGALGRLHHFINNVLPQFGPHEDAMTSASWHVAHSLLAHYLNVGLLHPMEEIGRAHV